MKSIDFNDKVKCQCDEVSQLTWPRLITVFNNNTQEVRVDLTGSVAPDYVFKKDYNLLPLSELEAYIHENNHLPEVPSAKEMEANGFNLKEMNLMLLKKVEELTLHLIEVNKKIDSLDRKVGSRKKRRAR